MTQQVSPLITFYKQGWENYQQALVASIVRFHPNNLPSLLHHITCQSESFSPI